MKQFEKLSKLNNTDIETIASVLKGVKIGQVIPFLTTSLKDYVQYLVLYGQKNGSEMMTNTLLPVLKELLRRGGISDEQYSVLLTELDKL